MEDKLTSVEISNVEQLNKSPRPRSKSAKNINDQYNCYVRSKETDNVITFKQGETTRKIEKGSLKAGGGPSAFDPVSLASIPAPLITTPSEVKFQCAKCNREVSLKRGRCKKTFWQKEKFDGSIHIQYGNETETCIWPGIKNIPEYMMKFKESETCPYCYTVNLCTYFGRDVCK
jgi:hypothetical protein